MAAGPDAMTREALERELSVARAERDEAQAQQAALAEVLRAIDASPGDLAPVFDVILERAMALCEAACGSMFSYDNENLTSLAQHGAPPSLVEFWSRPQSLASHHGTKRMLAAGTPVQMEDLSQSDAYLKGRQPIVVASVEQAGVRTILWVPLLSRSAAIGLLVLYRREVRRFTDRQITLVESFAAQAVIAMENARLLTEQREALEQQTATAEILRVISQSPTDIEPVMTAVAKAAVRFCGAEDAHVFLRDGHEMVSSAHEGPLSAHKLGYRDALDAANTARADTILEARITHLPDTLAPKAEAAYRSIRENSIQHGFRAQLNAPMLKDGRAIGCICLRRREPGAFTSRQIALLESFAAQAVIAIENVRLFTELRESLEQQTATAGILQAISHSPTDVQPVLDAVVKAAVRFCGALDAVILLRDGDTWTGVAHEGPLGGPVARILPLNRETAPGRSMVDGRTIHYPDIGALDPAEHGAERANAERMGFRSVVAAPMLRDGQALGAVALRNRVPGSFTQRQIALLEIFAAQAVIAIENVRLFTELRESLEQQTATTEVLEVINASPGRLAPVLDAMLEKAMHLCEAAFGIFGRFDGQLFEPVVDRGVPEELIATTRSIQSPPPNSGLGRLAAGESVVQLVDLANTDIYRAGFVGATALVDIGGAKTAIFVALRKDDRLVGVIVMYRREVRAFSDKQITLLQNFAAQAVIAMENARLLSELRDSLEQQTATADILRVIAQSPTDVTPVLDAVGEAALRFCGSEDVAIDLRDGEIWRCVAHAGVLKSPVGMTNAIGRKDLPGRAMLDRAVTEIPDIETATGPETEFDRAVGRQVGFRAALAAPLLRQDEAVGAIILHRRTPGAFSDRQIALLESFAAQAVIALENTRLFTELKESLDYQPATSELLEDVSRSADDIHPVFDTILVSAFRLCDVEKGDIAIRQGDSYRHAAAINPTADELQWLQGRALLPGRSTTAGRALLERQVVQVLDQSQDLDLVHPNSVTRARTVIAVPLLREGEPVGVITLLRDHVEAFGDREVALLRTFADQAVIAMENARLLSELRESLDQQTATAEILQVINSSPGDLTPVSRAILEKAHSTCGADMGSLFTWDGTHVQAITTMGYDEEIDKILRTPHIAPPWAVDLIAGQRFHHRTYEQGRDVDRAHAFGPRFTAGSQIRTNLIVPLRKDAAVLGFISANRREVRPYNDKEISLLENFAAQAVIAMENARLLGELKRRQQELSVTFEHMGDGVVMFDAELKLASWNRIFQELLDVPDDFLASRPTLEDYVRLLVQRGELGDRDPDKEVARYRDRTTRQWSAERTRPDGRVLEVRNNPVPGGGGVLIYSDVTKRKQAEAEIRAARDAAEEALERQTATADILKVIASSPTAVQPVLDAVAKAAVRFCGATDSLVHLREGDKARLTAHEGERDVGPGGMLLPRTRDSAGGGWIVNAAACHIPDYDALDPAEWPTARALSRDHGHKAGLAVPMLREGAAVGAIMLRKPAAEPFTPQQIQLLETFAAQAVIAIENVRLFTELRDSLERLKAAQANLVQSEKMASLGQLTAGIAHEIKNPLNFVNNFATLSVDLLDELKEIAGPALGTLDEDKRAELDETMGLLTGNLGKIAEHGKRADGIVKSMLSHSRGGSGDWQASDINALVEEALNLAYHGARAQDKEFNVTLERDLGKYSTPIEVVPQDVTRVFLNLFGNGFYAANKRRLAKEAGFRPTLTVVTRETGEGVEVKVRDNGIGIPPDVREKLFQPFFTTKPTGEGTGLGLSISYDIVTQQHGGTIEVESVVGDFTEFTVRLPRRPRITSAKSG